MGWDSEKRGVSRQVPNVLGGIELGNERGTRHRIADDQRRKAHVAVDPQLFPQWIDTIDGSVILRTEALIDSVGEKMAAGKNAKTALAACVRAVNRLDAREGFIGTIEAEDLIEVMMGESVKGGLDVADATEIIDRLRDW